MISLDDYFGTFPDRYPQEWAARRFELEHNAGELLERVNLLIERIPHEHWIFSKINSGWRPTAYNAKIPGAAISSKHCSAQAIDLADPDGGLDNVLFDNQNILVDCKLYMEHPAATKGWTHLQTPAPRSGKRVFYP